MAVSLLLTQTSSTATIRRVLGNRPNMAAHRVVLDPENAGLTQVGALTWLGGVRLTSEDRAFGGFSAMLVEGDRFTLLSDYGNVVRFRMGADWQPRDVAFGDLPGGPETGWAKYERDAESITIDPVSGQTWVGFEWANAIWRFDRALSRPEAHAAPAAMRRWPSGGGPEAMLRLRDSSFLVLSEDGRPRGDAKSPARLGLHFPGDPTDPRQKPAPFLYVPPADYDPVDMAQLPDGRVLVLNRRFSIPDLFTAKLTLIDPRGLQPNQVLRGRQLATLAPPLLHDNYEALAVVREGRDTIVWIASDDNNEVWEQSLLLKFRLRLAD
ncbi:esterase-like activity of phytase family protein [Sphingomonas sp. S2-65]|uniref:esterase-like activity of phytase family protein n=1 Tax=Sphingomonas sp. S2-65 TaxID=2903960 RepID=UPI001F30C293|nr:esterase-like activity of phytase family protein [Sphingomonas sp. S2-65]UYY57624.1 esterase-like activity of phytase family protein [Sphingomonas sp. S2-65]